MHSAEPRSQPATASTHANPMNCDFMCAPPGSSSGPDDLLEDSDVKLGLVRGAPDLDAVDRRLLVDRALHDAMHRRADVAFGLLEEARLRRAGDPFDRAPVAIFLHDPALLVPAADGGRGEDARLALRIFRDRFLGHVFQVSALPGARATSKFVKLTLR